MTDTTPGPGDLLAADVVRRWVDRAADLLAAARPVIDRANVFPVADSDTGTNLCLTLAQGQRAVQALPPAADLDDVLRALAHGALLGARGSSGVILSEYLRGLAVGLARRPGEADARALVVALDEATRCAYDGVAHPREGTILTAASGAAAAALTLARTWPAGDAAGSVGEVVAQARAGAQAALERSVHDLDVLTAARMLDSGAYGLVLVLDALGLALAEGAPPARGRTGGVAVSQGPGSITLMETLAVVDAGPARPQTTTPTPAAAPALATDVPPGTSSRADGSTVDPGRAAVLACAPEVDGELEVMYVLEHTSADRAEIDAVRPALRAALEALGDSVVVVGGPAGPAPERDGRVAATWQVHVHTDDPLGALRAGQRWTQRQVVVRSLAHQVAGQAHGAHGHVDAPGDAQRHGGQDPAHEQARAQPAPPHAVVACTTAPGLVLDLARAGAVVVLRSSVPLTVDDLLRAALETGASRVSVLPCDEGSLAAATALAQADRPDEDRPEVDVVESLHDLQVVAALSAWAGAQAEAAAAAQVLEAGPGEDVLRAASAAVRTRTVGEASLRAAGAEPEVPLRAAVLQLLDDAAGHAGLLTVLAGDHLPAAVLGALADLARLAAPGIEILVLRSGLPSGALALAVDAG